MKSYWQYKRWIELLWGWSVRLNCGYRLQHFGIGVGASVDWLTPGIVVGGYVELGPFFLDLDVHGP